MDKLDIDIEEIESTERLGGEIKTIIDKLNEIIDWINSQ